MPRADLVSGKTTATERWIADFFDFLAIELDLSPNTLKAYERDLAEFVTFRPAGIADVTDAELRQFVVWEGERGLAERTVARRVAALRMFFRFLQQEGYREDDPAQHLKPPKLAQRLPNVPTARQMGRLLQADRGEKTTPLLLRNRAILAGLYATGARVSEWVTLPLSSLKLEAGYARVLGKGRKERLVPLGEPAQAALELYLQDGRPVLLARSRSQRESELHVFLSRTGKPLRREAAWELVRQASQDANLPAHLHPHALRHAFATHLLENGAGIRTVQELLGHANIRTTQIYTHVDRTRLKKVVQKFHPRG